MEKYRLTTQTPLFAGGIERPLDALHETWSAPLRDFYAPVAAGAA